MNLFYSTNIDGDIIILPEEESKHCLRVLRMRKGDKISVTDGKGNLFECLIQDENTNGCEARITNTFKESGKRNFRLHIAICPTKNINRFEWFLEKCTEIGIDEITPVICVHSERKSINPERLNKILLSALKQSFITYLPILNPIISFSDFINKVQQTQNFIAICDENADKKHLKDIYQKGKDAVILIGPEGDFSREEIEFALKQGFKPVSLGENRLRTETAGILACSILNLMNV